jgi:hypothetical protein
VSAQEQVQREAMKAGYRPRHDPRATVGPDDFIVRDSFTAIIASMFCSIHRRFKAAHSYLVNGIL